MLMTKKRGKDAIELERHEAKYIVHPAQLPAIRDFIRPFCAADDNAEGGLPEYLVTTLQLDTSNLSLYYAKERETLNRFKLRIRTYGTDGECPVFLEIKRKVKGVIVKSRATIPASQYTREVILNPSKRITFRSEQEEMNYLNFVRVVRELGARPVVLIRYTRESYMGKNDLYSRLTFDRQMGYRPTNTWELLPEGGHWWSMDSGTALNRPHTGVILEMKTFSDAPRWMVDLTERFDLVRVGFCKYFTAVRLEKVFTGSAFSDASENCTYD